MKLTKLYRNLKVRGSLDASSISVDEKFTLPTVDGELGQIMIADGKGTVTWQSVSGLSLTTDDITEGSNLYFTIERVDDRIATLIQDGIGLNWTYNDASNTFTGNVTLAPFDTDDLSEGASNLYFTDERVDDRVSNLIQDGTGITWGYNDAAGELTPTVSLSAFNTGNLNEGSNLYFTVERAQDAIATLIQDGLGISWAYNDIANSLTPTVTLAPFDTDDLSEGATNLYFTGERVDDRVATLVKDTATVTWTYSDNGNLPGTLEADASSIVNIQKNGSFVAAYNTINFIEGSGINLNTTNDAVNSKIDVTITSTGGGIGGGTMSAVLSSGLLIGDPDITTLNFLEGFTITESPNRQINIDIDLLLDELADVILTSPILDGDTLAYDSFTGTWTNSQISALMTGSNFEIAETSFYTSNDGLPDMVTNSTVMVCGSETDGGWSAASWSGQIGVSAGEVNPNTNSSLGAQFANAGIPIIDSYGTDQGKSIFIRYTVTCPKITGTSGRIGIWVGSYECNSISGNGFSTYNINNSKDSVRYGSALTSISNQYWYECGTFEFPINNRSITSNTRLLIGFTSNGAGDLNDPGVQITYKAWIGDAT